MSPSQQMICFVLATALVSAASYRGTVLKRQNNRFCPPPPGEGILEVTSDRLDVFPTSKNGSVVDSLRFMCGQTQVMKKVPIGWEMKTQNGGPPKNVTLYTMTPQFVPLCCPGYVRDHKDICVPKCRGGCRDGVCVSPGNCACYQGYAANSLGECVLTCPCKCPHGSCRGDSCTCDPGYELDTVTRTCSPVCPLGCESAVCTAPAQCTCLPGYTKLLSDDEYVCSPDCGSQCRHGKCVAPHFCLCNEGYEKYKSGACVPRCTGCEHGDCVHPFQCRCHDGYTRVDDECTPICMFQCHNATCTAPNTCECISGFVKVSPISCVPECSPACVNADCVAPNQCECHKYFYKKSSAFLKHVCFHTSVQLISATNQLANDLGGK